MKHIGGYWGLAFVIFTFFNNVNCDQCTIQAVCGCVATNAPIKPTADSLRAFAGILANQKTLDLCNSTLPKTNSLVVPNNAQSPPNNESVHLVLSCEFVNTSNKSIPHDVKNRTFALSLEYPCDAPHPKEHTYSTGSVLVIIFFTCVFAYLGMGIAVRFFMLGARGIEVLPNLDFWKDFPALIRDGARFLQNGCKARPSDLTAASPEGYDAI